MELLSSSIPPTKTLPYDSFTDNKPDLSSEDYTVGWICALPIELAASEMMLDEVHPDLVRDEKDTNIYTLGRIGEHNIVLVCLPSGTIGIKTAAVAAINLLRSFPKIRFGLMVGIGGGAPGEPSDDPLEDLRLGDVVVSNPQGSHGGVIQYDFGKTIREGRFVQTGVLNKPPAVLRSAVAKLRAQHERKGSAILHYVSQMAASERNLQKYQYQGHENDLLFEAYYDHANAEKPCESCCEKGRLLIRLSRDREDPVVHYGIIGSVNKVMRHGATREKLRKEKGIVCFEMEAAGLMDDFPCLVIRGICNYSDTHKNNRWERYAAATAAAYAKELLKIMPASQVASTTEAAKMVELIQAELVPIHQKLEPFLDDRRRKEHERILDWLAPPVYEAQHNDALRKSQQGTGQWFLASKEFSDFLRGDNSTLFCPGIPGAGKTVLASIVIEYLRSSQNGETPRVAFLYCNYGRQDEQTAENLLSSLLRQLAGQCPSVPELIQKLYISHKANATQMSLEEISNALVNIIGNDRVLLVVDALDECSSGVRKILLAKIRELQMKTRAGLIAICRSSDDLECELGVGVRREIRAKGRDIEN